MTAASEFKMFSFFYIVSAQLLHTEPSLLLSTLIEQIEILLMDDRRKLIS